MIDALTAHKTADLKRAAEKKFAVWANKPENKAEYGNVLGDLACCFSSEQAVLYPKPMDM